MKRKLIYLLAALAFTTTACGTQEMGDTAEKSEQSQPQILLSILNDAKERTSLKSVRSELTTSLASEAIVWDDECFALSLPANDDGSTGRINLPFQVNFFGTTYSSFFINNNGNVTFNSPMSTFTPFQIEARTPPIIAAFLADVDTRGGNSGLTTYSQRTVDFQGRPAFCISWIDVGYYSVRTDKKNTFQMLLVDRADTGSGNFDIVLNYSRILWETGDASGGRNGYGGTSAGAGFSAGNGDPSAFFQFPGSLVNGALLDTNPATGLVHHSRNSNILGRYIFNVRNGRPDITPPVSIATVTPPPNSDGEHNGPVNVAITATDDESGVLNVTYVLSGATTGSATVSGASVIVPTISNLGVTTVTYYARDVAGNVEAPRTLTINIVNPDVTPPVSTATVSPPPDANGEHQGPVDVAITATDAESGVASITYVLSGATTGGATVPGASATVPTISNLGVTTVTYYARDVAGNVEAPRTLTITITEPCVDVNLNDFNLFLTGDYTGGHDVVGKVAVGGNITMENFAVGTGLAESDIENVLVAGGNLNITHGAVYGNAYYGGSTTADGTVTFVRGALAQGTPVDFTARGTEVSDLSTFLGSLPATGTYTREVWGGMFLQGSSADVNVFDINASEFNGATLFNINAPAGSLAVVNIRGASANFGGHGQYFSGGIDQTGVLYNFVDATSITANGFGFWGTVLAPNAAVNFSNGSFDGGIYAHSFTGNGEGHINALRPHRVCRP
ncbi:MAG TPA: choice-of-anchor A family protein [Hyalangium sp.]|nr:choice-of-anchor A family protein [Hyalangium sp.]